MFKNKIYEITITGLGMACVFIGTLIMIPNTTGGYSNLGDGFILLFSSALSPLGGFLVGGVASALVDALSGYVHYAPYTLIIKGMEGVMVAVLIQKFKDNYRLPIYVLAASIMVLGYFLSNWVINQSFIVALSTILNDSIQGGIGVVIALLLYKRFTKLISSYKN